MSAEVQGNLKTEPRQQIRRWSRPWRPPTREALLRRRLLVLLTSAPPYPGGACWRWWQLRQGIGGHVSSVRMRRAIDGLIAEGIVVEVWEETGDHRQPRHLIVLTTDWQGHSWGDAIEIAGRKEIVAQVVREAHRQYIAPHPQQ